MQENFADPNTFLGSFSKSAPNNSNETMKLAAPWANRSNCSHYFNSSNFACTRPGQYVTESVSFAYENQHRLLIYKLCQFGMLWLNVFSISPAVFVVFFLKPSCVIIIILYIYHIVVFIFRSCSRRNVPTNCFFSSCHVC